MMDRIAKKLDERMAICRLRRHLWIGTCGQLLDGENKKGMDGWKTDRWMDERDL